MDNMLLSGGQLLRNAWAQYKERWKTLVLVALVPGLASLASVIILGGGAFASMGLGGSVDVSIGVAAVVGVIVISIITLWGQIAMIYAVKDSAEKIGVKESFKRSSSKILPYLWIAIISMLIVLGGFILLIIPGIIWAIWYSQSVYVLIDQDLRGMSALRKSKEYVKGRGWEVFGRFVVIMLVYLAVAIAAGIIFGILGAILGGSEGIKNLADFVVGLVMGPLSSIYLFMLYKNLRSLKESTSGASAAPAQVSSV